MGLVRALWAIACTCFSRPRRLCVLLCTHPDPTLGPLYVPEEVRREFAIQLGLKHVPVDVWSFLLGRRGTPPTQLDGGIGVHVLPSGAPTPGPGCSPRLADGLATSPQVPPALISPLHTAADAADASAAARSPCMSPPRSRALPRTGPYPGASPVSRSRIMLPIPPSLMDAAGAHPVLLSPASAAHAPDHGCSAGPLLLDAAVLAACPFDAMHPERPVGGSLAWPKRLQCRRHNSLQCRPHTQAQPGTGGRTQTTVVGSSVTMSRPSSGHGSGSADSSVSDRRSGARSEQVLTSVALKGICTTGFAPSSNLDSAPVSRQRAAAASASVTASAAASASATSAVAVAAATTSPVATAAAASSCAPPFAQARQPGAGFLRSAALSLPSATLVADGGVIADLDGRGCTPDTARWCSGSGSIPSFRWCGRSSGSGLSEGSQGNSPRDTRSLGRASPILSPMVTRGLGRASPMLGRVTRDNSSPMPRISPSVRLAAPLVLPGGLHTSCGSPLGRHPTPVGPHRSCGSPLWRQPAPPLPESLPLSNAELQVAACGGSADQCVDRTLAQRLKAMVQWALQSSQPGSPKGPRRMTAAEALAGYPLGGELSGRHDQPLSPRSVASNSTSANTGTTATDCRAALASLRMLAQQLPPESLNRSPPDPYVAAAALAASLRTIGEQRWDSTFGSDDGTELV